MQLQAFVEKMKLLQQALLDIFSRDGNTDESLKKFASFLRKQKISDDKFEFKAMLHLIIKIANNSHRPSDFSDKIDRIFELLNNDIKSFFSNWEIFNIFKSNKRILLSLFRSSTLIPDKKIFNIINSDKYRQNYYLRFFFPEFKSFIDPTYYEQFNFHSDDTEFESKRKIGENENKICQMIRQDSIKEFTEYFKQTNTPYTTKIEPSIFETNSFLIHKKLTLIEYASFFGSFKIFNHLVENKVHLTPELWIHAIHGGNLEIAHLLEEKKIKPNDETFCECIKEAIKCHHNEFASVLLHNNPQKPEDVFNYSAQFFNFKLFSDNFVDILNNLKVEDGNESDIVYNMIQYDQYLLVDYLLKNDKININARIISNSLLLTKF